MQGKNNLIFNNPEKINMYHIIPTATPEQGDLTAELALASRAIEFQCSSRSLPSILKPSPILLTNYGEWYHWLQEQHPDKLFPDLLPYSTTANFFLTLNGLEHLAIYQHYLSRTFEPGKGVSESVAIKVFPLMANESNHRILQDIGITGGLIGVAANLLKTQASGIKDMSSYTKGFMSRFNIPIDA